MKPKTLTCTCTHPSQDKLYGAGKRLHNYCRLHPKPHGRGYRCTVCRDVKGS